MTSSDVLTIIKSLNNSSSNDIDGVHIRPVKFVADILVPVLVHIYNLSLDTSVFPSKMQIAKVVMLYKKGDHNELGNYRPISVLPIFSRVLEKLIHKRIINFIEKNKLLTQCQFGICKKKSTELALLQQQEYIFTQFEKKLITVGGVHLIYQSIRLS